MLSVLGQPTYRRLFSAQLASLVGTGLATVALGLLAYHLDPVNAAGILGTALAIKMIAYVVLAPLAQALLRHLPRRSVLVAADLLRLVAALCLPFVTQAWQVYLVVLVLQAASATFTPTYQSVIPDVLPDEQEYTAALSLTRVAYDLESVLSPVLAAVLMLLVPAESLFFGTALGFAASAALIVGTVLPPRADAAADGPESPLGKRARHGYQLFFGTAELRPILAFNLAVAAAGSFTIVQTVVIVRGWFGQSDAVAALVLGASGLGSMLAAIALPRLLERHSERRIMLTGAGLLTAATALIPLALGADQAWAGLLAIAVLWALIGLGWSSVETPISRIIRRSVATTDLGDVFAAQFSLSHACWLVTYPIAGWLGTIALAPTAGLLAGIAAVATAVAALLWPRSTGTSSSASAARTLIDE